MIVLFITSVSLMFSPFVADLHNRGERKRLDGLFKTLTRWTIAATIPVLLVLSIAPGSALKVFGSEFAGGQTALLILLAGQFVNIATGSVGFVLIMVGRTGWDLIVYAGSLIMNLGIAFWLCPRYGMEGAAIANAATFAVSIALVGLLVPTERTATSTKEPLSYSQSLREGFRFLRNDRLLVTVIGTVTVTNLLDAMFSFVIIPALFNRIYESSVGLGITFGSFGAGALLGALAYGWIGERFSRRWTFCLAFLFVSVRGFVFALAPPVPVLMLTMFVTGLAGGPLNPILAAVEYERTPVEMRGRVLGLIQAMAWGAMPLGVLLGGVLVEATTIGASLVISAAVYVSVALSLTVNRGVSDLDRVPVTSPS